MQPAIEVHELRKTFKVQRNREGLAGALRDLFRREYVEVTAVKDISFTIPQGEICGYIGENGAGKSTTIKMLAGILVPTSGTVRVAGYVPWRERERFVRNIGVVFGQRSQLWWDIGVIESFRLLRKVYRVPMADYRRRLDELVERLQLGDLLNRPVRKLSLGQRMRCELVASLLHNPSILFLDEPTIGLDIVVKTEIREFLIQLNREHGTTILLTTHDLQDIEALCSRVIMLDDGRIIYDGGLDELKTRWSRGREIRLQFGEQVALEDLEGKLALMFFGYTHCPDFCPATLDEFKRIREDLGDRAGDVQFVFVSVDGERDTPEVMRDYLAVRGVDDFVLGLTGPEDDVRALGQPLGVFFERNTSSGSAAGYLVDHSTHSFLLDRNGDVRVVYSFTTPPDVIADTIRPYL